MMPEHLRAFGFAGSVSDYPLVDLQKPSLEKQWTINRDRIVVRGVRDHKGDQGAVVASWKVEAERARRSIEEAWLKPIQSGPFESSALEEIAVSAFLDVLDFEPFGIEEPAAKSEAVTRPDDTQLNLWTQREFSPSKRLIRYWQDGLEFHLQEQQNFLLRGFSRFVESTTMRGEFTDQLLGALVEELRFARKDEPVEFNLVGTDTVFAPALELRFSNLFPIRPLELGDFLKQLAAEMLQFFQEGNVVSGSWGAARAEGDRVKVYLTPREKVDYTLATKKVLDINL